MEQMMKEKFYSEPNKKRQTDPQNLEFQTCEKD